MSRATTIAYTASHDYWDARQHVWYPRCAWWEAYVAPDRDRGGWTWWAGEAVDPLAGGLGEVSLGDASLRGHARSRRAAEAAARAALRELAAGEEVTRE